MIVCISEPIRKIAFDFSIFRKVPGFLKDPIGSLKKVVYDYIEKDPENNLPAVLDFLKKSPDIKNAGSPVIPILIISALLYLAGILGKGFGESLEKYFEKAMDKEKGRQTEIHQVIDSK
jgi:hypothetical protein